MSKQEHIQAAEMAQTKVVIKQAYLKTLQEELQKLAESPETIERINRYASVMAEAHASGMIEQIKVAYNRRMNEIKRDSKRLRLMVLLPLSIVFGLVALYNFETGHVL